MAGLAVRLGGRRSRQVERYPARQGGGGDRYRGRANLPGSRLVSRGPQGAPARPRAGGCGVSFRRVLSLPRRGRRGSPGGGPGDHPAGRLREGRRRDRGRRPARPRDGADGPAAVPPLTDMTSMRTRTSMSHAEQAVKMPVTERMVSPMPLVVGAPESPPYLMAALVSLGALVLYGVTLAPTTQFWDTSEYIAAAKVLGIPHPPGNPLFTLLAHTFGMIPWSASYAVRINLFAAVTSAVAAGCWFLIGERFLRSIVPATWPRRLAALAGAVCAATAFTVWNQSVVNEKVYTLSLLSIALIRWFILRWDDQHPGTAHDHYLLLIVYLLALTSTNHMMGVLVGPVVAVLLFPPLKDGSTTSGEERRVEWTQWWVFCAVYAMIVASGLESWKPLAAASLFYVSALLFAWWHANNWRFALLALAVVVLGVSVYVFLPIRAAHYPAINEGEPTNWRALYDVLTRAQYGKPPVTQRQASFFAQLLMSGQYFSWQWGHDLAERWQALLEIGRASCRERV